MIFKTVILSLMVSLCVGLTLTPESGKILTEVGRRVTLRCQGEPSLIGVTWKTPSGQRLPMNSSQRVYKSRSSLTEEEVTITHVRDEDAGNWTCSSSRALQLISETMTISLQQGLSARLIHKGPITEGGEAVFDCTARGYPLPTVQWYNRTTASPLDQTAARVTVTENRLGYAVLSKLVISNVRMTDAGYFICRVQNGPGISTSSASGLFVRSSSPVTATKQRGLTAAPASSTARLSPTCTPLAAHLGFITWGLYGAIVCAVEIFT